MKTRKRSKRLVFGIDTLETIRRSLHLSRDSIDNQLATSMEELDKQDPVLPRGYHDEYHWDMTMECYSDIPERYEKSEL